MVECGSQALRKVSSDAGHSQGPCSELVWPGGLSASRVGAEGMWLEAQNRVVCFSHCIESSSSIHPCDRKRRVLLGASLQLVGRSDSTKGALQNPQHHLAELPA